MSLAWCRAKEAAQIWSDVLRVKCCHISLGEPCLHFVQHFLAGRRRTGFERLQKTPPSIFHHLVVVVWHHPHCLDLRRLRGDHSGHTQPEKALVIAPNQASLFSTLFGLFQRLLLEVFPMLFLLELSGKGRSIWKNSFALSHVEDALSSVGEAIRQELLLVLSPCHRPWPIGPSRALEEVDRFSVSLISRDEVASLVQLHCIVPLLHC
mmetsp:Transcript_1094/g.2062  ORF Transcript_1094/g.2062 Transcript_1094/m.2062 type:complete len:208 (-) Transcript_1094:96-719(-)